jgi:hypothetical protein
MSKTLKNPHSGREITVPDETAALYVKLGYKTSGAASEDGTSGSSGVPDDTWGFADLKAYALELGVDVGKEKSKKGLLALIEDFDVQVDEGIEDEHADVKANESETDGTSGNDGTSRDW